MGLYLRYSGAVEKLINLNVVKAQKCEMYVAKEINYIPVCDSLWSTVLYCENEKELYNYNNEECLVLMLGIDCQKVIKLINGKPLIVRNGYMTKEILPPNFVFYDPYFSDEKNPYSHMIKKLPKEIYKNTEVSGVIMPRAETPDNIKIYTNEEKEAIYSTDPSIYELDTFSQTKGCDH